MPSADQPGGTYGAAPQPPGGASGAPSGGGAVPPGGGHHPSASPSGGGASPISSAEATSFFGALFDFSFTHFATAKIVKFVYVLIFAVAVLAYIGYSVVVFNISSGLGVFFLLVLGPIMVIVTLAVWRMTLEFYLGIARMAEDIRAIKSQDRSL